MGAKAPMLVGADAPAGMGEDALVVMRVDKPKAADDGSSGEHGGDDLAEENVDDDLAEEHGGDDVPEEHGGERPPRLVRAHSPVSAREDPAEPGERQPTLRWRRERPIPVRGGDQKSASSRWAEERQSLRPPGAGEVEDPSEMERQVRDQLYGPGFRRR